MTRVRFKWVRGRSIKRFFRIFRSYGKRILPLTLLVFVGFALFFGIRGAIQADPYFKVERVSVYPSGVLSNAEYKLLEHTILGKNFFSVNLQPLSRQLEKNLMVKKAEVVRALPNEVKIFLTERKPIFEVQLKLKGVFYGIADDRVVVEAKDRPKRGLLVVHDYDSVANQYQVGSFYDEDRYLLILGLLKKLREMAVLQEERVIGAKIDRMGGICLILADGVEIILGKRIELSDNLKTVLGSLLGSSERRNIRYIDLRYQDVIVKRKSEAA